MHCVANSVGLRVLYHKKDKQQRYGGKERGVDIVAAGASAGAQAQLPYCPKARDAQRKRRMLHGLLIAHVKLALVQA